MTESERVVIDIINKIYGITTEKWKKESPLPNVLLHICLEYLTTEIKEYHKNGTLYSHGFAVNGRGHGERKVWYSNGILCSQECWVNGKRHGESKTWYRTAHPSSHGFYVNGKKYGKWKVWELWKKGILTEKDYTT